jgi:lysophospholipase L1-like esterase
MKLRLRVAVAVQNIALSITALILFAALLEILLRTTHLFGARLAWTTPDSLLGYRFDPGAPYWSVQENDHPITGRINRFGWRDRDWTSAKPAGSYRIAVLGDSFVEAFQVEADSTFVTLTQADLSAQVRHPVELMNFGRSGVTQTEQLLILSKDVLQFAPDMVLLFFFPGNDITDVERRTTTDRQRPFFLPSGNELVLDTSFASTAEYALRSRIDVLKRHSALVSLLSERYLALRLSRSASKERGLDEYLRLCTKHPDPMYLENYALNKRLMLAMNNLLAPRGIRFVVVVLPLPAYMPAMNRRFLAFDSTFDQYCFERDLSALAAGTGMGFLGLETAFAKEYANRPAPLNWHNMGHWTYAGHRLVATKLASWLRPVVEDHFARARLGR